MEKGGAIKFKIKIVPGPDSTSNCSFWVFDLVKIKQLGSGLFQLLQNGSSFLSHHNTIVLAKQPV